MREAVMVEAVRSPVGKRGGSLSQMMPIKMGAMILAKVVNKAGIDTGLIDVNSRAIMYQQCSAKGYQG